MQLWPIGLTSCRPRGPSTSSEFWRRLEAVENYIWNQAQSSTTSNNPQAQKDGLPFAHSTPDREETDFSLIPGRRRSSRLGMNSPATTQPLTEASSFIWPAHEIPPMSIPIGHTTTNETLLHLKTVKTLFGEFPRDVFLRTESTRHVPRSLSCVPYLIAEQDLPSLNEADVAPLVDAYFRHVHVEMPIVDRAEFLQTLQHYITSGPRIDCDFALCLVVLALGCASLEQIDPSKTASADWVPGAQYISPGLQILIREHASSFSFPVNLPRGLILASKYFGFLLRPLQSWKLVHMASTSIQYLNGRYIAS
ncbi:uncharacterized protein N7459_001979 [Penicillium hispanicum]|uniref:uncharacterized protein n=1 Tax=Penicillium hispanicum TaxID=1080232 RepID=UPI00253FF3A5|nr:uncharacterized protein N7459_001979 [Penicillium hispanicum]KAJ5591610.1 hypothetical protein N7459_001979 [Penicillium hispanicum]